MSIYSLLKTFEPQSFEYDEHQTTLRVIVYNEIERRYPYAISTEISCHNLLKTFTLKNV